MIEEIKRFIRETVESYGFKGAVVGVSGGIDSAVVGKLCVESLGSRRVFGLILPERDSAPQTLRDARLVCDFLGIQHVVTRITGILRRMGIYRLVPPAMFFPRKIQERYVRKRFQQDAQADAYLEDLASQGSQSFRQGLAYYRIKHRVRMCLLYLEAEKRGCAVMGTTNKSELRTGFYVKWGDDSADIEPLLHLYKTQVYEIARELKIPNRILAKSPSPDLIPGITDEFALGIRYADLDRILMKMDRGEELRDEPIDAVQRAGLLLEKARYRSIRNLHL